eukprot:SAG22_NODE_2396_length_2619_cov_1.800794_2_plen_496_part_00
MVPAGYLEELCGDLIAECRAYLEADDQAITQPADPLERSCLCSFPFFYRGRRYTEGCVWHGHEENEAWCATEVNADRILDWGPQDRGPPPNGSTAAWGICAEVCPTPCGTHDDCPTGEYCASRSNSNSQGRRRQLWLNEREAASAGPQCMPCHACVANADSITGTNGEPDCPDRCGTDSSGSLLWGREVLTCDGRQGPTQWIGDGVCDDGAHIYLGHTVDFNCDQNEADGGDCAGVAAAITDCEGHRAPAAWLGDGICDDGVTHHRQRLVDLDCAPLRFDGGDCVHKARLRIQGFPSGPHFVDRMLEFPDGTTHHYRTYRVFLELQGDAANVAAIFGTEQSPLVLPPAWQYQGFGGRQVGGTAPELWVLQPQAEYDSWLTIGAGDGSAAPDLDLSGRIWNQLSHWNATHGLQVTAGGVSWSTDSGSSLPRLGAGRRVLIAQLTTEAGAGFHRQLQRQRRDEHRAALGGARAGGGGGSAAAWFRVMTAPGWIHICS